MFIGLLLSCIVQFIVSGEAIIIAGISLVRLCYLLISSARENKLDDQELGKPHGGSGSCNKLVKVGATLGVILLNVSIFSGLVFLRGMDMSETSMMSTIWVGLVDLAMSLGACAKYFFGKIFWNILTYTYNTLLVIFIATHLLVGAFISFLVGLYVGIYLTQNYAVPRITEPSALYEKIARFLEQHRVRNIRPAGIIELIKDQDPTGGEIVEGTLHVNPRVGMSNGYEEGDGCYTAQTSFSPNFHTE